MMRGGISLTMPRPGVQERILLHLRDFYEFSESIEVPFSISQMGLQMLFRLLEVMFLALLVA